MGKNEPSINLTTLLPKSLEFLIVFLFVKSDITLLLKIYHSFSSLNQQKKRLRIVLKIVFVDFFMMKIQHKFSSFEGKKTIIHVQSNLKDLKRSFFRKATITYSQYDLKCKLGFRFMVWTYLELLKDSIKH